MTRKTGIEIVWMMSSVGPNQLDVAREARRVRIVFLRLTMLGRASAMMSLGLVTCLEGVSVIRDNLTISLKKRSK